MIKYLYHEEFWDFSLKSFGVFCWLIPIMLLLITRRFNRPEFRRILAFSGFTYLLEHLTNNVHLKNLFSDGTNAPWYHLGIPILFFLMTRFYRVYLGGKRNYHLDIILPTAFTVIAIVTALHVNEFGVRGFELFPTVPIGLYSLCGIILAVGYFINLLSVLPVVKLEAEPLFWISAGFLIYYSGNFLLWGGVTFIDGDRAFFDSIYRINAWMTILLNTFFIISIITVKHMKPEFNPASTNKT
jgi:hypothetical protein